MTPAELRTKLETAQANEWGYKTIKEANEDGMNVRRNNCTIAEIAFYLKISEAAARTMVMDWKYNNLVKYTGFAGLDQMIFI
jgi:hypothetical protein